MCHVRRLDSDVSIICQSITMNGCNLSAASALLLTHTLRAAARAMPKRFPQSPPTVSRPHEPVCGGIAWSRGYVIDAPQPRKHNTR